MRFTIAALAVLLLISCGSHPPHATGDRIVVLGDSVARGAGDETGRGFEGPLGDLLHRTVVNRWDSLLIARFANDPGVTVIRIADLMKRAGRISAIDHFHPSASGYALIAARIAPSL